MKKRAFPQGIFLLSALLLLVGIFYFVSSPRRSGEEMLSLHSRNDSGDAKRTMEIAQKATGVTASAPASTVPSPVPAVAPVHPSSLASPASGVADGFELPADLSILEVLSSLTEVISTPDKEIDGRMLKQTTLIRTGLKFSIIRVVDSIQIPWDGGGKRLIKREIMVGTHFLAKKAENVPDEDFRRAMASHGVQATPSKYSNGAWKLIIPEGSVNAYEQIQEALSKDPLLRVVEPDYVVTSGTLPNDPRFSELWGLFDAPNRTAGQPVDIGAPEAWSVTTGSMDVTVAVIDTGVDSTHPDLAANMAVNTFEVPGNGMDDDGNGFVDDSRGWDFYSDDNDPKDEHFHGTHVAGIIGAVGGNGVGVTGVNWKVQILPVRFLGPTGSGFTSDAELSVRYATARGASLSNNSWGGGSYSQILKEAIEDAGEQGSIFVASAGNLGVDTDALPQYPSAYPAANIVSVAAITRSGTLAAFSNYGRTSVDVGAPGVDILSTFPTSATTAMTQYGLPTSYGSLSGTSMAAPHVSGSLALLKSADASLSGQSLLDLLFSGVEPLKDLRGLSVTEGRVQVFQSLRNLRDLRVSPNGYLDFHALAGNMPLAAEAQIHVSNPLAVAIPWTVSANVPWLELSQNGGTLDPGAVQTITVKLKSIVSGMNAGTSEGVLSIRNLASGSEIQRKISLRLQAPSTLPFTENFEQKELSPVWERSGTGPYRTAINSNYQPQQGTGHLILDSSLPLVRARNELTCTLNLAGYQGVVMTFNAKSFSDEPDAPISNPFQHGTDHDGLSVSADGGTTWFEIHPLRNLGTEYEKIVLNLDELVAAHGLDYTSGFKIRFTQVDDFPAPTDGIALDAISITGDRTNGVQLATQSEIKEGGPAASATIALPAAASVGLVASITTSRPDRLQVAPSVNFTTGATTAVFTLNAVNNTLLDGDEEVTVFVSVPGHAQISRKVIVRDNESATLMLELPASVSEGVSAEIYGTLRASRAPQRDITVQLSVSPASQVSVPGSVIIPAGKTEVQVPIRAWDDNVIDGTVAVTIRAASGRWVPGLGTIQVLDNEMKSLSLTLPSTVSEYDGVLPMAGIVDAGGIVQTDLNVTLVSDDGARLAVLNEVIVHAGARMAYFDLRATDDDLRGGDHSVRITASANSYGSVQKSVLVRQGATSIDVLELPVFDIVYSPVIRRLVGSSKKYPGSLLLIDPRTRVVTNEIPVSGIPGPLALASDGRTLYVGLKDQPSCEQFDLVTRQSTRVFSIRAQAESQMVRAESLVGSPLGPDLVVISKAIANNSPRHAGVVAYQNGVPRLSTAPSGFGSNVLAFGTSGADLFGLTTEGQTREVIDLNVDTNGVQEETVRPSVVRHAATGLRHVDGRLFFSDGTILDAQTLGFVSQLPVGADLCPDLLGGRLFGIESIGSGQILRSYEYPGLSLLDTWNMLGIRGTASRLLRWDLDGLAFRTSGGQIAILRTTQLPVAPEAKLAASPSELIRFEGAPGGPFTPAESSTQLINSGLQAMNWSASPSQSWLQVQPASGTLAPGASVLVRVSVNSLAEPLGVGTHIGAVTFQNLTNGAGNLARQVALEIAVPNTAPTISPIANQEADEGTQIGPLPFAIGDAETPAGSLILTVVSSNPALFPENQITMGGAAESRTLTLAPTPQAFGSAEITVQVNDGRSLSSSTFLISVSERPEAPLLEPIADQTMQEDKTLEIPLIIADPDTSLATLSVTALSSDGSLVPNTGLFITRPTANLVRLVVVPAANAFGSTQINVKVSDGTHSVTRSFLLTVAPVNDPPTLDVIENFSVAVGGTEKTISLTGISSGYLDSAQPLAVTATANPSNALQSISVSYGSPAPTGSLLLTPSAAFKGNVNVTVTVSDGELEFQRVFQIGVGVPRVTAFNPTQGPPDSVVKIQGDNFGVNPAGVNVFFPGGLKAEVLSVNPSEIQVRVPRHAVSGRFDIAINGYAIRPPLQFTVPYATTGNISPSWFSKGVMLKGPLDNRAGGIRSADLNGDSKPDLVTVGTRGIRIYRNEVSHNTLHESSFTLAFSGSLPSTGCSVEAADLDGDGKLDLVVGTVNFTFVYPNTSTAGRIQFDPPIPVHLTTLNNRPSAFVDVGDLNNDGKLDILAAACPGIGISQLLVVQNQSTPGEFIFSNRFHLESGTSPDEAEIVDLDQDGNSDLVVGSFGFYRSATLRNLGGDPVMSASNFAAAVATPAQIGRDSVECFDVNRDGKPEINFIAGIHSTLVMYPNNSTPGAITVGNEIQRTVVGNVSRLRAFDVNADGWLDAVGPGFNNTFIAQNNRQTTVGANSLLTHVVIPFDTSSPNDICMADFDGDGRPDFATATNGGSGVELYKNNHVTGTVPTITSFSPRFGGKGTLVTIQGTGFSSAIEGNAVFVGGTLAQVITASSSQLKILIPENVVGGRITVTANGLTGHSMETFEFVNENSILLRSNSLKPRINFEVGPNINELLYSDIDGDGRKDVILTRSSPPSALIYRNLTPPGSNVSNASFAAAVTVSLPGNPFTTRVEDLDGDNRPELIFSTGSALNYTINYLRNISNPSNVAFSATVVPITSKCYSVFAVGDLNGDEKKEIVTYFYEPDDTPHESLYISRNTTNGGEISFSNPARSSAPIGPNNIDLKDFNGDGKLDIALRNQSHLWIIRNDSTVSAIVPGPNVIQFFSTGGQTAIGDIDGSGLPEGMAPGTVLKYSLINHGAAWSSTSLFGNSSTIPIVSQADALALADLDGDSLPEFIYVTSSNSKLTFIQNFSTPGRVAVGEQFQIPAPVSPRFVLADDINSDGLIDVIVLGSMEFSVYENQRQNTAPSITGGTALSVLEDHTSGPLQIVVSDSETSPDNLVLSALSSDTTLLANDGIQLSGQGALRTLRVTPEADRFGTANVTVTVSDGSATSSMMVAVIIKPVNDAPAFTAPPVAYINENGGETLIQLNGINAGAYEENQALTLVTSASHPELLARRSVDFQSASSTASIKLNLSSFSLLSLQSSATAPHITVTVMDNGGVANNGENARSIDIPARIVSGFEFWRRGRFNESEALSWDKSKPRSDFDGDGLSNLAEYAFGSDPQKPDTVPHAIRTVTGRDGKHYLEIAFERLSNDERTRYVVEVSENLRDWNSGDVWTEVVETSEQSNGMERQSVRTRQPLGSAGPLFMRVRVISEIADD